VALAVAAAFNRGPTACLVPATLIRQWELAALRVQVPLLLCSHEQVSRGRLPERTLGLVIIDESHHFRNPGTRRYTHLGPWLLGRPALLVTATPIVNRTADLAHQILLAVRDDALVMDGVASLRGLLQSGCPSPSLGQLVIESEVKNYQRPRRIHRISRPTTSECAVVEGAVEVLSRLRLSACKPIAALIRGVLLRAVGSSPAALYGALHRYRRLLRHASDALQSGRTMDRSELRQFTGELGDQLIWWELLPASATETDIELDDLGPLEVAIQVARAAMENGDGKLDRLREILSDATPALVFATSRDTVGYIRDRFRDLRLAWCTGNRAGIGNTTLPRTSVLGWFRAPVHSSLAPRHLIVTDVAAEGLDLQRAARVVHYDLPWTPMRVEQREGRSVRYGSNYQQVEVVRFIPPPVLERSLKLEAALVEKGRLPASAGMGAAGERVWRWRTSLAERLGGVEARAGVAAVDSPNRGLLAGFALYRSGNSDCLSATVLWVEADGSWTETPETIAARLIAAAQQTLILPVDSAHLNNWLALLARPIRDRLSSTQSRRWVTPDPTPAARRLATRLQSRVRDAARRHDPRRLAELEGALAFVAGGHTAGEAALVERLANVADSELNAAVGKLPKARSARHDIEVRLTGLVVFGPMST
jgi:helicase-like protein